MTRNLIKRMTLIAGLLVLAGVGLFWFGKGWWTREKAKSDLDSNDPRIAYSGPYRNVRPGVAFVGDAVCLTCHTEKAGYRQSAMGRSLVPIAQLASEQRYDKSVHNPFDAFNTRFQVEREGDHVWHRQVLSDAQGQPLISNALDATVAIGSGHRGHSYFTTRDGFVFQTPISWYSQKAIWDASPGFASGTPRPIVPDCLFCHSNRVEPIPHTINRYKEPIFQGHAIGCERCHGPGELHAEERRINPTFDGEADTSIVNPVKLPPALREDVCQQCHLEGESRVERPGRHAWDFRPGLALHDFWSVFVPAQEPTDEQPAVSQVEQMIASRCFQDSAGKVGCISCHNPHKRVGPDERDAFYRARCIACHSQKECSVPVADRKLKSPSDNCIDCHMPRLPAADIPHTAMTDHRIVRAPGKVFHGARDSNSPPFGSPLRFFREDELPPEQRQSPRELGIALVEIARDKGKWREELPLALRLIERALVDHPTDVTLWEHKGTNLMLRRERFPEALAALETAIRLSPDHEVALSQAAYVNHFMQQHEEALPYWERAIRISPYQENYRFHLSMTLSRLRRWPEALKAAEEALRLDPFSGRNRTLKALCLHQLGQKEQAREEFDKVRALNPPEFELLRMQYENETH